MSRTIPELRVVKFHACDVDVVKSYSTIGEVKHRTKLSHDFPAEQKWMIAFNFIRTDFFRRTANADGEFCVLPPIHFVTVHGLGSSSVQHSQHAIQRWLVPPVRILKKKVYKGNWFVTS